MDLILSMNKKMQKSANLGATTISIFEMPSFQTKCSIKWKFTFGYTMMPTKTSPWTVCRKLQVLFLVVNRDKTEAMGWGRQGMFGKLPAVSSFQNHRNNIRRNRFFSNLNEQGNLQKPKKIWFIQLDKSQFNSAAVSQINFLWN